MSVKERKDKILGVFLAIGESFSDFAKKGQDKLLIKQNFSFYSKAFRRIYVFSYENEQRFLLNNVRLCANKWRLSRYFYSLLLPFLHKSRLQQCHILRGFQLTGGIPGIIASKIYGIPLVINYGYSYQRQALRERKLLQSFLYWLVEPVVLSQASCIIVTSKYLQAKLEKRYKKKLVYIPNGVDIEKFRPAKKKKKAVEKQVVFVGRLERTKNLNNLIEAIALLSVKRRIKLVLIGAGRLQAALKKQAQHKGVDLELKGVVPHDELANHLTQADVFVLPSLAEGHPKALLEAMSCGLPVIGTDVVGIKEIIENGKNGLLCPTDAESIAKAIWEVISNEELANKLGETARKYVVNNFSLRKTMIREVRLLQKLAKT